MSPISLETIKKVHVVGIGGIGISAMAKYLHHIGKVVVGTNDCDSPQTLEKLEKKGVQIFYDLDVLNITPDTELIVYTDAWLTMHPDFMGEVRSLGIPTLSYFEALGEVTKTKTTIAVAGTNGKTTTTGMLAKLLIDAGLSPTVFVGSILKDFDSNFIPGDSDLLVVEACEYKNHVLKLHPKHLVLLNIELDHTDFFEDIEGMQDTFRKAAEALPHDGVLVTNPVDPNISVILEGIEHKVVDYSSEVVTKLNLIGEFNVQNAKAAQAAAKLVSENHDTFDKSLETYAGSWRRFDFKGTTKHGALLYDDYAHHPIAIEGTIAGARAKYPEKHIVVVFHPHLYSRTKSLFEDFVNALATADRVILAPIFKARETPDPSISHTMLATEVTKKGIDSVSYNTFAEIQEVIESTTTANDLVITMGAGDIYKVADRICG